MAIPNETIAGNGGASTHANKKKARKGSSARAQMAAASRSLGSRASGPVETLFTQEPDTSKEPIPPYIWIDFPTEREVLLGPLYNIRLGVGGADLVEISIDK